MVNGVFNKLQYHSSMPECREKIDGDDREYPLTDVWEV